MADPIPSKGLRDIPPDGSSEEDQASRRALLEAAQAFGATPEQLEEIDNDAASKG